MTQCHSIHSKDDLRLPIEYRKKLSGINTIFVKQILRKNKLNTVCEDARCPNISECFSHKTATFMIMGDKCTRRCKFCSVTTKKDRKSTRLNSSHTDISRMPSSA